MRASLFRFCIAILIGTFGTSHILVAQFVEPKKEELAMKADPKVPDATAESTGTSFTF
jgi:hypothetical protein